VSAALGGLGAALGGVLAPPLCWACGERTARAQPLCPGCRLGIRRLAPEPVLLSGVRAWAPAAYSGPARDLVRALKFRGATGVADLMAAQIAANAPSGLLAGTLVPVPSHARRMRSRGYNQAAAIAAALGRRAGLAVEDCLERSGPAATQVGRARAERRAGPVGRISVRAGRAVPERALLVDDVVTTGATLRASAAALRAAGCRELAAVAFARTLGR
jgi:ComF family protein